MAVFNSTQVSRGVPIGGVGLGGAQVKEAYFSVDIPVGANPADTIEFGFLPPNSMVRDFKMKNTALGAGTINVGDAGVGTLIAANPSRYLAAQAVTAAGLVTAPAATGMFFKNTTAQRLRITGAIASGTTTAAGTIEVAIAYSTEEPQQ